VHGNRIWDDISAFFISKYRKLSPHMMPNTRSDRFHPPTPSQYRARNGSKEFPNAAIRMKDGFGPKYKKIEKAPRL